MGHTKVKWRNLWQVMPVLVIVIWLKVRKAALKPIKIQYGVQISQMNLDTIPLTAVWIGLSIHCVPPCRFFFFFFLVIIPVAAASVAFPVKCWFTVSCTGTYVFLFSEDVSAWVPNKAINISQYRFDLWEKEVFDHFPGKQGTPMTRVCFSLWIAGLVGGRGKTRYGS